MHYKNVGTMKQIRSGYKLDDTWACFQDDYGWSLTHIESGLQLGHAATIRELQTIVKLIDLNVIQDVLTHRDERGIIYYYHKESQDALCAMCYNLREYGWYR
jgi:hypothetical protein